MDTERSANPETAFLRSAFVGVGLIALIAIGATWVLFVVHERRERVQVARRLQGGWVTGEGMELTFDFNGGDRGTVAIWSQESGQSTSRARVDWTRAHAASIAVGPDADHETFFLFYFTHDPNAITMEGGGSGGGSVLLTRVRRPSAPSGY